MGRHNSRPACRTQTRTLRAAAAGSSPPRPISFPILALALLLFASLPSADSLARELSDFDSGLVADIAVSNAPLLSSPQTILVRVEADAPENSPMPLYVIRQTGGDDWEIVRLVGALSPASRNVIELQVDVQYARDAKTKTRYALVGRAESGKLYGSFFEISEDWSQYEAILRGGLSRMLLTVVPLVGIALIVAIAAIFEMAYSSRSRGITEGEYTTRTLFFPKVGHRPL